MKILIADDHPILRQGLRLILAESGIAREIGEAATGDQLLDHVRSSFWDVVILDIRFPGESGLDLLRQVKAIRPRLPVLVLSMHAEEQYAVRAMRRGASGYLTKESAPEELVRAVERAARGGRYVTESVAEALAAEVSGGKSHDHHSLSDREFEVLCMIARGHSPAEIAVRLCVSTKTVGTYRARLKEKMGFSNNAQIVRYAVVQGLI